MLLKLLMLHFLSFLCILIKMVLCNAHIEAWVLSYQNYLYFRKLYDIWYVGLTNILFTKTSSMCIYVAFLVSEWLQGDENLSPLMTLSFKQKQEQLNTIKRDVIFI